MGEGAGTKAADDDGKAPAGCYWRGSTLWGRAEIAGRTYRWSLRTRDAEIASRRLEQLRNSAQDGDTPRRPKSVIYFIAQGGFIKIGVSTNLDRRMKELQLASPRTMSLLFTISGTQSREAQMHLRFAAQRVHGEWFRLEGELLAYCRRRLGVSSRPLLAALPQRPFQGGDNATA